MKLYHLKTWKFPLLLLAVCILVNRAFSQTDDSPEKNVEEEKKVHLSPIELKPAIIALFPEKSCGAEDSRKGRYPYIVFACAAVFKDTQRDAFLDLMFKSGYKLRRESYSFAQSTGVYDFEFTHEENGTPSIFFIKLHFRKALYLYKNPYNTGRIILFVDNISSVQQLTRWQSLGLKISYGVMPFKENTGELAARIGEYSQNLFMSLSLNPMEMSADLGSVLTVNEALEQKLVEPYLNRALEQLGDVDGVIDRGGNEFLNNISALRTLFTAFKAKNILHFIDSGRASKSAALGTARLMSLNALTPDINLEKGCGATGKRIHEALALTRKKEYVLVLLSASDTTCYNGLKRLREARKIKTIDYIFPSEVPR